MKISVLTLFPSLYEPFVRTSLIGKAVERGVVHVSIENMMDVCAPKERVDAPTFGHGAGMLIKPVVVEASIEKAEKRDGRAVRVFFSPHGKKMDQRMVRSLFDRVNASGQHLMLIAARYEGMDARVEAEYADEIVSLGDFVLMGGDIPALALIEAFLRYVPTVVGRESSVEAESFSAALVDYPEYTAPVEWKGRTVPEVVRSGDHAALAAWRLDQAARRTVAGHFDWFRSASPSEREQKAVKQHIPPHYVVLMHDQIALPGEHGAMRIGTTSVTSIDIHDIARSACMYGFKKYFVVTPLDDQQRIVQTLLDFWQKGEGLTYNNERAEAVERVLLMSSLEEVERYIMQQAGAQPIKIATSARTVSYQEGKDKQIGYHDQEHVWHAKQPVLFVLGTGRGLSDALIDACDYVLEPLKGLTDYNHLSVRSAAAIIFDRWLGLQPRSAKTQLMNI